MGDWTWFEEATDEEIESLLRYIFGTESFIPTEIINPLEEREMIHEHEG